MIKVIYEKIPGKLLILVFIFVVFLTGQVFPSNIGATLSIMEHGIREAIIAGIIIALLVAVHSYVLSKKGDGGGSCGCGTCSCGRIFDEKDKINDTGNRE